MLQLRPEDKHLVFDIGQHSTISGCYAHLQRMQYLSLSSLMLVRCHSSTHVAACIAHLLLVAASPACLENQAWHDNAGTPSLRCATACMRCSTLCYGSHDEPLHAHTTPVSARVSDVAGGELIIPHGCVILTSPSQGDLLLFAAGTEATVNRGLDRVRQYIAKQLNLADSKQHALLWVTDFPMFEWNEEEQRHQALHHPFTAPNQQQDGQNGADLSQSTALAYDLVYNGVEIGGKLLDLLVEHHMLFVWINYTGTYVLLLTFSWHAKCVSVPAEEFPALSAANVCMPQLCESTLLCSLI